MIKIISLEVCSISKLKVIYVVTLLLMLLTVGVIVGGYVENCG